jgi:hypothetical protein
MDRYMLEVYFYDEDDPTQRWLLPDFKVDLKERDEASDWMDHSVRKAILLDRTTGKMTTLKDE